MTHWAQNRASETPVAGSDASGGRRSGASASLCIFAPRDAVASEGVRSDTDAEGAVLQHLGKGFAELLRKAPGFIAVLEGPNHRFVYANEAYEALIGGRRVVGRTVRDALPEVELQQFPTRLDEVFATGVPFSATCAEAMLSDERGRLTARYLDFTYQPIFSGSGTVVGILVSGVDVTAQKVAVEQARRLRATALQNDLTNARTIEAAIAHELNQPLAAAAAYLDGTARLLDERGPTLVRQGVSEAHKQVVRAGEIIRRLKGIVARQKPIKMWIAVDELFSEAITLVTASGVARSVTIETKMVPGAEKVFGDKVQLEQILVNLIRNAVEASHQRSECEIHLESAIADDGHVELTVSDNGPGLSAEARRTLFSPFTKSTKGGQGVGLSICRTIAEAHGGSIGFEAPEAGGAAFWLRLPPPSDLDEKPLAPVRAASSAKRDALSPHL